MILSENFQVYILVILSIIISVFYRKGIQRDTEVDSLFFTIDTSRTLKFMLSYIIALQLLIVGLYITLPVLLLGLTVTIAVIVLALVNLVLVIIGLLLLFFGISISLFGFDILFNILEADLPLYFENYYLFGYLPFQVIFLVIAPFLVGSKCGKYAEDRKSVLIVGIIWYSFLSSGIIILVNLVDEAILFENFIELLLIVNTISFILIGRSANNKKETLDTYDLPEIIRWRRINYFIFGILPLYVTIVPFVGYVSENFENFDMIEIGMYSVVGIIHGLFILFNSIFFIRGDHPIHEKISEIEMREDLLEMAKEFRDLDETNIEDFVKKTNSRMI